MLTAISNVKINEANPEQILDYLCCLKSIQSIDTVSESIFNIEDPTDDFFEKVNRFVKTNLKNSTLFCYGKKTHMSFGQIILQLIESLPSLTRYVMMVEADHFCMIDSMNPITKEFIYLMEKFKVDVVRASFLKIENISADGVHDLLYENHLCRIFKMNTTNYSAFQHKYPRYYVGTNCIFSKEFAIKLFSQDVSNQNNFSPMKPHAFEVPTYKEEFFHTLLVPKFEIFSPMFDENHGESNISVKVRKPQYYTKILNNLLLK